MGKLTRMRPAQQRALRILNAEFGSRHRPNIPADADRGTLERSARTAARVILSDHDVRVWLEAHESTHHINTLAGLVNDRAAAILAGQPASDGRIINGDTQPAALLDSAPDRAPLADRLEDLHELLTVADAALHP